MHEVFGCLHFLHVKRRDLGSSAAAGSPLFPRAPFAFVALDVTKSFLALKPSVIVTNVTPFLSSAPPLAFTAPQFWLQVANNHKTMFLLTVAQ